MIGDDSGSEASATRERSLTPSSHRAPVHRSVAGSFVVHAAVLIALLLLASSATLPIAQEPEAVSMVFQAAPATAPAAVPQAPSPEPAPEPAVVPAPPQPPPVPLEQQQPTPQPPSPRLPPQTQATPEPPSPPRSEVPPQPPPPPETEPLPVEIPLPPPPAPEPPPLPERHPPAPRPAAAPPRPTRTSPTTTTAPEGPPAAAPTAQTATTSAPAAPSPAATIAPGWQSELAAWLAAHKTYPEIARRRGEQGRAVVRFTVDRDGQVLDVQLVSGTGSTSLDDAVERMLHGAHLPPFPPGMDEAQVTVTVQIRYRLE